MASPPVTVITSTYNWPSALENAIHTVLGQTMGDFEYIIVGDACTDDTQDLVMSFSDKRIKWINLETNSGNQSYPNQRGLNEARGQTIAYMNHDDLWFEDHLSKATTHLEQSGSAALSTLCVEIAPPGNPYVGIQGLPIKREGRVDLVPMTTTVVHRLQAGREAGGWRDWRSMPGLPTQEFFSRLALQPGGFQVLPYVTALKFHSADRPGSYIRRTAEEQAGYRARLREPELRHHLIGQALINAAFGVPRPGASTFKEAPNGRNGWLVDQFRIARGLEPMAVGSPPR
jgi:glycosyltransferase involved in cell wall biosynthesis